MIFPYRLYPQHMTLEETVSMHADWPPASTTSAEWGDISTVLPAYWVPRLTPFPSTWVESSPQHQTFPDIPTAQAKLVPLPTETCASGSTS